MILRPAIPADARDLCGVVRRSIVELCVEDHRNDPAVLRAWLRNKRSETAEAWITHDRNRCIVAEIDGRIGAAGCVTVDGAITLNYVAPPWRFQGVSSALVDRLEAIAREYGNPACTLFSTRTARRFYLARGYADNGPEGIRFGLRIYPMRKLLAAAA
jgi:GNAT superfamily N-acetyltransferase